MRPIAKTGQTVVYIFNENLKAIYVKVTDKSPWKMWKILERLFRIYASRLKGYSYRIDRVYHNSTFDIHSPK